jgi:putative oxidoreductase
MTMRPSLARLDHLGRYGGFAPLAIRLFAGVFLIYMSQDNIASAARMTEFERFLAAHEFPWPDIAARVSVYAQFGCGLLLLAGAFTRWAALVMIIHFTVAIAGVHLDLPFRTLLEPCAMLAVAIALFIGGAGRVSVDHWFASRGSRSRA